MGPCDYGGHQSAITSFSSASAISSPQTKQGGPGPAPSKPWKKLGEVAEWAMAKVPLGKGVLLETTTRLPNRKQGQRCRGIVWATYRAERR